MCVASVVTQCYSASQRSDVTGLRKGLGARSLSVTPRGDIWPVHRAAAPQTLKNRSPNRWARLCLLLQVMGGLYLPGWVFFAPICSTHHVFPAGTSILVVPTLRLWLHVACPPIQQMHLNAVFQVKSFSVPLAWTLCFGAEHGTDTGTDADTDTGTAMPWGTRQPVVRRSAPLQRTLESWKFGHKHPQHWLRWTISSFTIFPSRRGGAYGKMQVDEPL